MKSIYKIISALALAILVSTTVFAANNKLTVEQRATLRMQKMNSVCNLTSQQQEQVKQLYIDTANSYREHTKANKALKANSQEKNHFKNTISNILTTEQMNKWKAYKSQQKKIKVFLFYGGAFLQQMHLFYFPFFQTPVITLQFHPVIPFLLSLQHIFI